MICMVPQLASKFHFFTDAVMLLTLPRMPLEF